MCALTFLNEFEFFQNILKFLIPFSKKKNSCVWYRILLHKNPTFITFRSLLKISKQSQIQEKNWKHWYGFFKNQCIHLKQKRIGFLIIYWTFFTNLLIIFMNYFYAKLMFSRSLLNLIFSEFYYIVKLPKFWSKLTFVSE